MPYPDAGHWVSVPRPSRGKMAAAKSDAGLQGYSNSERVYRRTSPIILSSLKFQKLPFL